METGLNPIKLDWFAMQKSRAWSTFTLYRLVTLAILVICIIKPLVASKPFQGEEADAPICAPVLASSFWTPDSRPASVNVNVQSGGTIPFGYVIYNYKDQSKFGNPLAGKGEKTLFCDDTSFGVGSCTVEGIGKLIVDPNDPPRYPLRSEWVKSFSPKIYSLDVESTGIYCVQFVNAKLANLKVSIDFQNPYGKLPAELFPLFKMISIMFIVYAAVTVVWMALSYMNRRHLVQLQNHIAAVLFLSVLEMGLLYTYYYRYNETGSPSYHTLLSQTIITSVRGTASLFFLLLASMGYGVVMASLEGKKRAIYALVGTHLIFSIANNLSTAAAEKQPVTFAILITSISITITYAIFFQWILSNLANTKESLALRKQQAKLGMYDRMTKTLYILFGAAGIMMIIAVVILIGHEHTLDWHALHWKTIWFYTNGWPVLLTSIATLVIAYIFRPQAYNRNYGMDQLHDFPLDDQDLEGRAELALRTLRSKTARLDSVVEPPNGGGHSRWATENLNAFQQEPYSSSEDDEHPSNH